MDTEVVYCFLNKKKWISCGLNGVDLSVNDGKDWTSISMQGFHVCQKAKNGHVVFFAGNEKIGKIVL